MTWNATTGVMSLVIVALAIVGWRLSLVAARARREQHIRSLIFRSAPFEKLREKHPQLELKDCHLVARALREFFLIHLRTQPRHIAMPSRVVDDLWHEFILDTRAYDRFCRAAFGGYFHHVPARSLGVGASRDAGLRVTWRFACLEENINPRRPTRLPLLFAIDDKMKIAGGFSYSLERQRRESASEDAGVSDSSVFACTGDGLIGDAGAVGCGGGSGCGGGGGGCGGGGGD